MAIPPTLKYRAHQESSPKFGREEREARDDVKTGDNGMSSEWINVFVLARLIFRNRIRMGEFFKAKIEPLALVDSLRWPVAVGHKKG